MFYLKVPEIQPIKIDSPQTTVGFDANCDILLKGKGHSVLFILQKSNLGIQLLPGDERIHVNGKRVGSLVTLAPCDRIEWRGGSAVLIDNVEIQLNSEAEAFSNEALRFLEDLGSSNDYDSVLKFVMQMSKAERGYLLIDTKESSGWKTVSHHGVSEEELRTDKQKVLISSTILADAISKRIPVYVQSLIGHPWEAQASLMGAQVFSIACFPLVKEERVFGAVYLCNRTPGKELNERAFSAAKSLTSIVGSLFVSRERSREPNQKHNSPTILFDQTDPSSPIHQVLTKISKLAVSDLSVLVQGETGTGKELVARELHRKSARKEGPFVAINCGAIPPTLMESVLFGYVKGAFTGALKDTEGKFVQAHGGTLFLDEVGDMPLELQVKLLRALQEKMVEPVGSNKSIAIDVRVIAATHQDLNKMVSDGRFRKDLFYRLNGSQIVLPPLRDRKGDIFFLAKAFLKRLSLVHSLSESALRKLESYSFPGNVRELEQIIERAVVLSDTLEIGEDSLELIHGLVEPTVPSLNGLITRYAGDLKQAQEAFTQDLVKNALDKFEGSRKDAAHYLGISERTLYRLIEL